MNFIVSRHEMELNTKWLETILKKEERMKRIEKVIESHVDKVVSEGENYASDLIRVKMTVLLGSGKTATKSVVIKKLPDHEKRAFLIKSRGIFAKEIKVRMNLLGSI